MLARNTRVLALREHRGEVVAERVLPLRSGPSIATIMRPRP